MERERCIMIAYSPKSCELMFDGRKIFDIRKSKPKIDAPFKCYIYCTLKGGWLTSVNGKVQKVNNMLIDLKQNSIINELNGFVIGEYICNRVDKGPLFTKGKYRYCWDISNLKLYDKPLEVSQFFKFCKFSPCDSCEHNNLTDTGYICGINENPIIKPPKSWIYVDGFIHTNFETVIEEITK